MSKHTLMMAITIFLMPNPALAFELFQPADYIQTKLQQNDIVFLGNTHQKPKILKFIAELIPTLKKYGVSHVGLEIPSDQQSKIDAFMETGTGLENIQLHSQIDCPEYWHLFQVLRESGGPNPIALDEPYSMHSNDISQDEWMARELSKVLDSKPAPKILIIIGSLHALKKLEWQSHVPNKHLSIREYIQQERPFIRMWSVPQLIDGDPMECDFTKRFSPTPNAVALDVDDRYHVWVLGLTHQIAILPTECFELVDGVIVY